MAQLLGLAYLGDEAATPLLLARLKPLLRSLSHRNADAEADLVAQFWLALMRRLPRVVAWEPRLIDEEVEPDMALPDRILWHARH